MQAFFSFPQFKMIVPCVFLSLAVTWFACSDEIEERSESFLDLAYFPLKTEHYWMYQVDSTLFDDDGLTVISKSSFIKEEIRDSFIDVEDNVVFIIDRYWKKQLEDPWKINSVWTSYIKDNRAFRTEENLKFIKMVFPLKVGIEWDGNSFINDRILVNVVGENVEVYKNWEYKVLELLDQDIIDGVQYDDVVHIQHANDENQIELRFAMEKYARGIGLVYKEMRILDTQCIERCVSKTWEEKAERGFIVKQVLLDFN